MTTTTRTDAKGPEPEVQDPKRRRLLSAAAGALCTIVAAGLAVPLVGMFLSPVFVRRKVLWLDLGEESVVALHPHRFTYSYVKTDGWFEKTVHGSAYAVRAQDGKLIVLSNICPHLGCGVRWNAEGSTFDCPCHNGKFDREGKVVAGPPPKPLPRLNSRVVDGKVQIQVEDV